MRIKFLVVVLLQVLLLVGMIGYREHWISTGERILLRTVPLDPRDIFRGDYVSLSYDISNLDLDALGTPAGIRMNDRIFVSLIRDADGTYKAVSARTAPPAQGRYIQGRALHEMQAQKWEVAARDDSGTAFRLRPRWFVGFTTGEHLLFCLDKRGNVLSQSKEMPASAYKPQCFAGDPLWATVEEIKETRFRQLSVEYGIESYFVEEGKGKAIETARNARDLIVEVSLRNDGKGLITGLVLDGKRLQ